MVSIPPPITQMKTEFERARRWRRARHEPLQFGDVRWEALDRFLMLGFPTMQDEEWRFTDVTPISGSIFTLALQSASDENFLDIAPLALPDAFGSNLIFVNGYCLHRGSTFAAIPHAARVKSLSQVLDSNPSEVIPYLGRLASFESRAFVALNTALFSDGAFILIPPHTVLEQPIHLRFISTGEADMRPAMCNPRVLVVLGDRSRATVVESYVGPKGVQYFTNAVTEIALGENAVLDHYKLQCESKDGYHVSATNIIAAAGATYSRHTVTAGGALVRDELAATLGGEDAKCTLDGLYIADGERLVDHRATILHTMPRSRSNHVCNGVLAGRARGVFDGKIMVAANANQSDAKQVNRNLLLSEGAQVNSTKYLEKLATDARCIQRRIIRHIDAQAGLFARSRGTQDSEARRMVIDEFIRGIAKRFPFEPLARSVEELVQRQVGNITAKTT